MWDVAKPIADLLVARLHVLWKEQSLRTNPVKDARGDPARTNFIWTPWIIESSFHNNYVDLCNNIINSNNRYSQANGNVGQNVNESSIKNLLCILRSVF